MDVQTKQAMRIMRFFKLNFIVAGAMFIFLAVRIPSKASAQPSSAVELIVSIFALAAVGTGFFVPKLIVLPPESSLLASSMSAPIKQWFNRCILILAFLYFPNPA